ncbi:hypothetical protein ZIOFF_021029 [Zingiber officinale]|uniref:Protein kinase domain-containing protein n=1 Tax=Zingiber officinale TaxID=94328 RepID=A0A8J5H0X0_ZINOF|nr:hypothetical protein ZIOFF_021029 [Zingiber officinale]
MPARSALLLSLFFWFLPAFTGAMELPLPPNEEVLGLIVFKAALQDPTAALTSWNEADASPCNWAHLHCDPDTGRVTRLALDSLFLSGPLPRGLDRLAALAALSLSNNNLSGPIPPGLSLLPSLRLLDLSRNAFSGRVPQDLALLPSLISLELSSNALSGPLPDSLFSAAACRSLRLLSLAGNRFDGPLPVAALSRCSLLLHLNLSSNRFSGSPGFASSLWSLSRLRVLDLSSNAFAGAVPNGIENLHSLKVLRLNDNRFSGAIPGSVGLCPHLTTLDLSRNSFDGSLPSSMRYLTSLTSLRLSNNQLEGDLPQWLGSLTATRELDLSNNKFTGNLPASLGNLKRLNYLDLSNNRIVGSISDEIAGCTRLTEIHLKENKLNGSIPQGLFSLGLQVLDLSSNALTGAMPAGTTVSATLQFLDLSDNKLSGTIPPEMALFFGLRHLNLSWNGFRSQLPPELGLFRSLSVMDLRNNALYGSIPGNLCESGSLYVLQVDDNFFSGPIPEEIGNCSSLYLLSLSHNYLNGSIPPSISQLKKLEILNLEFNNLSGEIPPQLGALDNLLAVNISHNRLIGRLPPCKMNVPKPLVLDPNAYLPGFASNIPNFAYPAATPVRRRRFLSASSIIAISAALSIVLGVLVVTLLNVTARRRIELPAENGPKSMCSSSTKSGGPAVGRMVAFSAGFSLKTEEFKGGAEALLAKATEIGKGAFGTSYKASSAKDGSIMVVKRLVAANIVQYHEYFDREVRLLGKVMHPNVLPLRGYYWTPQLQLLVTDYAPNGTLHSRLHERDASVPPLSWPERFKIVLGVAKGVAHLHQAFRPPIIHYGLKPNNILLDENGEAKVSDFGLARLLQRLDKHVASERFQSAMGYMAPELACQSLRVNEKCDVYGMGVLMVEVVTGRKPVEYGEEDVVILIDQVRSLLDQCNVVECVDASMGEFPEEEVLPVLKLGLVCTSQIPSSRPSMAEVVQILEVIKAPI